MSEGKEEKGIVLLYKAFFDLLVLSLIGILASLPVFTLGVSLTALFRVIGRILRKEDGYMWPEFWRAFKENFCPSIGYSIFFTGVEALVVMNLYQIYKTGASNLPLTVGFTALAVLLLMLSLYVYALISRFSFRTISYLKIAFGTMLRYMGRTLLVLLVCVIYVALLIFCLPLGLAFTGLFLGLILLVLKPVFSSYEALIRKNNGEDVEEETKPLEW